MEAERDGALIVQQARDYRTQKLKQARTDAQKEVQSMKEAKEDDFKSAQNDVSLLTLSLIDKLTLYSHQTANLNIKDRLKRIPRMH